MAETFQTSFIPKTPFAPLPERMVVDDVHNGPGFLGIFAYFLLFLSIAASGGVMWYRTSISAAIDKDLTALEKTETLLDQELLNNVRSLDSKITISQSILGRHYSVAYVLDKLAGSTTPNVQFDSFTFKNDKDGKTIQIDGFAKDYASIAEQSRGFSESAIFKNHLFSGLSLDDTKNLVRFKLDVEIPDSEIAFAKVVEGNIVVPVEDVLLPQDTMPASDTQSSSLQNIENIMTPGDQQASPSLFESANNQPKN